MIVNCPKLWFCQALLHNAHRKTTKFGKITVRSSRSFKVNDFGTNRKLIYDFLSVINTNLLAILHRLPDIAFEVVKYSTFLRKAPQMRSDMDMDHTVLPANYTMPAITHQPQNITAEGRRLSRPESKCQKSLYLATPLAFNSLPGRRGSSGTIFVKFLRGCQWKDVQGTKWRRKIAENFNRLSRAHECYRQTDGRQLIANVNKNSSVKPSFESRDKNGCHTPSATWRMLVNNTTDVQQRCRTFTH